METFCIVNNLGVTYPPPSLEGELMETLLAVYFLSLFFLPPPSLEGELMETRRNTTSNNTTSNPTTFA